MAFETCKPMIVLEPGELLYREGDPNDYAYIVGSGLLSLYSGPPEDRTYYERRGEGAIVGELSIMTGNPRCVTVEAVTRTILFRFDSRQILRRFKTIDPVLRACVETSINFSGLFNRVRAGMEHYGPETAPVYVALQQKPFIEQLQLERDMVQGLAKGQFALVYQPIIDLIHDRIVGFEALMRWHHPVFGLVPPDRFIRIAEEIGRINHLTLWALRTACEALARFDETAPEGPQRYMSVNISGHDIARPQFVSQLSRILEETGVSGDRLNLEITETALVQNPKEAGRRLSECRELGCGVAMDDFGTGYSNFAYLKTLPFTMLKIDRCFAGDAALCDVSRSIVKTLVSLGEEMALNVVAEGLETPEDVATMREIGCLHAQGYSFSRPVSEPDMHTLLAGWTERVRRAS